MNQHYRQTSNKQVDRASTEIFRFPTSKELRYAQEQEQARAEEKNKSVVSKYKDEDLSGCLSGSLKTPQKPAEQPKAAVTYKDEDLSGCLSGFLKPQPTRKTSQRDRFAPTQRNVNTGEITPIERDDLSGAIAPLDEEKSGWLYFN